MQYHHTLLLLSKVYREMSDDDARKAELVLTNKQYLTNNNIGPLIAKHRSKILSDCKYVKVSELWKLIKPAKSVNVT